MTNGIKEMLFSFLLVSLLKCGQSKDPVIYGNGEVLISSYFSFYSTLVQNGVSYEHYHPQTGIMLSEALNFAIKKINNDSSILHGFKIKVHTRGSSSLPVTVTSDFLDGSFSVIGPGGSEKAYVTSIIARSFLIPVISYNAGYPDVRVDGPFDAFFRTVPSDLYRVRATLDVIKHLNWNYIGVVSSYGNDGERTARAFYSALHDIGACLAVEKSFGSFPTENDFEEMVLQMDKVSDMKAVVLFTTHSHSEGFLRALKRTNLTERFNIIAFYGFTGQRDIVRDLGPQALSTIGIELSSHPWKEFEDYFLSLTPQNSDAFFRVHWQQILNCSFTSNLTKRFCSEDDKLSVGNGFYPETPIEYVVGAVYGFATALGKVIEKECEDLNTSCTFDPRDLSSNAALFRSELMNMSTVDGTLKVHVPWMNDWRSDYFAYDIFTYTQSDVNQYKNVKVGHWHYIPSLENAQSSKTKKNSFVYSNTKHPSLILDVNRLKFRHGQSGYGLAQCSKSCQPGSYRVRDGHPERQMCCWTCKRCPNNAIVRNETCVSCGVDAVPSPFYTHCVARVERFTDLAKDYQAQILIGISGFGFLMTLTVVLIFLKFNNSRIVKASGRDLCYFLLVGTAACFLTPICYVIRPSPFMCGSRAIMPGFAFILCYAPLFLKTNRIYRIFRGAQVSVTRPPLISPQSQIIILTGILFVQVLVGTVWMVSRPPVILKKAYLSTGELAILCDNESFPLFLNLGMSLVFMISCTWMAFKTRNFPKNFNEAKYIGFTMYITCICWALFLPTYIVLPDDSGFLRQTLMAVLCVVIGFVTLLGLFSHRIKLLLLPATVDLHAQAQPYVSKIGSIQRSEQPHVMILNNSYVEKDLESTTSFNPSALSRNNSEATTGNISF